VVFTVKPVQLSPEGLENFATNAIGMAEESENSITTGLSDHIFHL
jgi:hypothetical protein